MTKKKQVILYIILFGLFLCTIVAVSYAFYSFVTETNSTIASEVNMPSCISLSLTSGTKISLSGDNAVPISDGKALSSTNYRYAFTVQNNCNRTSPVEVILSTTSDSTMPIGALKYVVVAQNDSLPAAGSYLGNPITLEEQVKGEILTQTGETVTTGYKLSKITLNANETKNYYLYLWIDENEGNLGDNTTTNKTLSAHLSLMGVTHIVDRITMLVGTIGTDSSGNPWGVVSDHGIRYVGQNPSNFVWFNCSSLTNQNESTCERWRIIGVFEEKYDTDNDGIADTTGNLVKIIRNDTLGSYSWDYKQSSVGSSTTSNGSNDWSDSQLMMMLNPPEFVNSGYVNEEDASPVHSNTISGEYIASNGINIYHNMGSYFDSSKTAYSPASTSTSGFTSTTQPNTSTFKRVNPASQSMIATVKWYLTGPNGTNFTSNTNGLASHFYNYERNIESAGSVYTGDEGIGITRPKIWYGKIGLMYPSDYGYATSGNPNDATYKREGCLNQYLNGWNSGSYQTYCANNSWLRYYNTTGSSVGQNSSYQWTITPYSFNAHSVFRVDSGGRVLSGSAVRDAYAVRSVLYLESGVSITGGEGTYASPYALAQ